MYDVWAETDSLLKSICDLSKARPSGAKAVTEAGKSGFEAGSNLSAKAKGAFDARLKGYKFKGREAPRSTNMTPADADMTSAEGRAEKSPSVMQRLGHAKSSLGAGKRAMIQAVFGGKEGDRGASRVGEGAFSVKHAPKKAEKIQTSEKDLKGTKEYVGKKEADYLDKQGNLKRKTKGEIQSLLSHVHADAEPPL